LARTDILFELIRSLTKGEKRNFKLLTQITSSNKKYVKLFDIVDCQEEYDENKVKSKFKGEAFVRQIAVQKNYLYNLILKSLSHYYKKEEGELSTSVFQVKILIDKNLYAHARKLLRKVKEKAKTQERFYEYLQLLEYDRYILRQSLNTKAFEANIREIEFEEKVTLEKVTNLVAYRHLWNRSYHFYYSFSNVRVESQLKAVRKLLEDPLLEDITRALSVRAKVNYLLLRNLEYGYSMEPDKLNKGSDMVIEILDRNPAIRSEMYEIYIERLQLTWIHYHRTGHFGLAADRLRRLKEFDTRMSSAQRMVFEKYHLCGIAGSLNIGDISGGLQFVESFEKGLKKFRGKMQKRTELQLYYLTAYFFLVAEMPEKALSWINAFLNEPRVEAFADMQSLARIMNLLIHFELGNLDLLEYKWKAAHRYIYKRDRLLEFEKSALSYLKRLAAEPDNDKRVSIFERMNADFTEIVKNNYENNMNNQLDLICWSESRFRRQPWHEVKAVRFERLHQRMELTEEEKASGANQSKL